MKLSDMGERFANYSNRRITYNWTGPYTTDQHGKEVAKRIKLSISHDKDRKAYTATISRCETEKNDLFRIERYELFGNSTRVAMLPVARHSDKALDVFVAHVCEIIDMTEDQIPDAVRVFTNEAWTLVLEAVTA